MAQAWLGEIGPAPHLHLASHEKLAKCRVGRCPGNNISARKRKYGRTGDAGTYIKPMLIQAAWAAIWVRGRLQARYSNRTRLPATAAWSWSPSEPGDTAGVAMWPCSTLIIVVTGAPTRRVSRVCG